LKFQGMRNNDGHQSSAERLSNAGMHVMDLDRKNG